MLIVIEAAAALPVTVAQARKHCNAPENGDDDALVERSLRAAIEYVQNHCTLILAPTTLQYRADDWPPNRAIELPRGPVRDIESVAYLDVAGIEQTVAGANYSFETTPEGGTITFTDGYSAPALKTARKGAVRVTFNVGYDVPGQTGSGDDPNLTLPALAKIAVLLLTEHWYDNRGVVADEPKPVIEKAVDAILSQIRVYR